LYGQIFSDRFGVLGNVKATAKKSIMFIPVIGWLWFFGENIFLERSFEKDREKLIKQVREIFDFPDPIM
jgi:lysophosphatidic acid acyltransferase / lysophosphatidylinositol acyltransferase